MEFLTAISTRIRTRIIVILAELALALNGCAPSPDASEVGPGLETKLHDATHMVIAYSELHGESNIAYQIDEAKELQRLIPHFATPRRWKEIGVGGWSSPKIAFVEFRDATGTPLWYCTLLPNSISFTSADDRTWLGSWPNGLERVMSVAKRVDKAKQEEE